MPQLKSGNNYFIVDETPAYEPCGSGEHLYLRIQKNNLTTDAVIKILSDAYDIPRRNIGFAGRKDKNAITTQWFSLYRALEEQPKKALSDCGGQNITIIDASRHSNKLRLGHVAQNTFRLGIDCTENEALIIQQRLNTLYETGLSNAYGPQRFGYNGATLTAAQHWANGELWDAVCLLVDGHGNWKQGDKLPRYQRGMNGKLIGCLRKNPDDAELALHRGGSQMRDFLASAAQSAVFNAILQEKEQAGTIHVVTCGDVVLRKKKPIVVTIENIDELQADQEITPSGPMPGYSMPLPCDKTLHWEQDISLATAVNWKWFDKGALFASPGLRRPLFSRLPQQAHITKDDDGYWIDCVLPSGVYATQLLHKAGIALS